MGGRGELTVTVMVMMDSGRILAPLMEKLMETGHMEEFVEQVRGGRAGRGGGGGVLKAWL